MSRNDTNIPHDDSILSARANPVAVRRIAREWAQAELAHRAGISRAAVSAIETGRLTPSVTAALSLARALDCTVEELFQPLHSPAGPGAAWAWAPPSGPCRYWEAEVSGGRLLFPVEESMLNAVPHDGVWENGVFRAAASRESAPTLVIATCDPAAGLLAGEYQRESGFRMLVFPRGGGAALDLAAERLIHVAAIHRSTEGDPGRNAGSARGSLGGNARLLRAAAWEAGVVLPAGIRIRSVSGIAGNIREWAAREPGSSARECLDGLLGNTGFSGKIVHSHRSVAEAVQAGWADAGVCVKFAAAEARLGFLPLRRELLDFCFHGRLERDPRVLALVRVLQSRRYRRLLSELPGYSAGHTGELHRV